jgi:hypothetical protein
MPIVGQLGDLHAANRKATCVVGPGRIARSSAVPQLGAFPGRELPDYIRIM